MTEEVDLKPYLTRLNRICEPVPRSPPGPAKVLDHLFIGSEFDATSLSKLRRIGITHILNCASKYARTGQKFYGHMCEYAEYDAEDDSRYNMLQHFSHAYSFIEKARLSGGKILVHCLQGINRSGLIVVAYVMVHLNIGPLTAAETVKKRKANILVNDNFQNQLVQLAQEKGLLEKDKEKLNEPEPPKSTRYVLF